MNNEKTADVAEGFANPSSESRPLVPPVLDVVDNELTEILAGFWLDRHLLDQRPYTTEVAEKKEQIYQETVKRIRAVFDNAKPKVAKTGFGNI